MFSRPILQGYLKKINQEQKLIFAESKSCFQD